MYQAFILNLAFLSFVVRFLISSATPCLVGTPLLTLSPLKNTQNLPHAHTLNLNQTLFLVLKLSFKTVSKAELLLTVLFFQNEMPLKNFKDHEQSHYSRFAHSLTARSVSWKFSLLGTRCSISSVTLQPVRKKYSSS